MARRKAQIAARRGPGRPPTRASGGRKRRNDQAEAAASRVPITPAPTPGATVWTEGATDEQVAALWFNHKKRIISLKEQAAALNGKLRAAFKLLKSETGILRKEAEFAISLGKDDDDGEIMRSERRRRMLARWEGHPVGMQADLFDDAPEQRDYRAEGRKAGLAAEPAKPPKHLAYNSLPYLNWMEGWHEGNTINASQVGRGKQSANDDLRPRHVQQRERDHDAIDSLTEPAGRA
jgi:hypothetical protein